MTYNSTAKTVSAWCWHKRSLGRLRLPNMALNVVWGSQVMLANNVVWGSNVVLGSSTVTGFNVVWGE